MNTLLIVGFLLFVIATLLMFRRRDRWWKEYQRRKQEDPEWDGCLIQPEKPWPRE